MGEALVVGAGVIGLSTAIRLQERGWRVRVWTADDPRDTVSCVAAAIWYPFRAYPAERVLAWSARAHAELVALAGDPAAGIRVLEGTELWRGEEPAIWRRGELGEVPRAPAEVVPDGYAGGQRLRVPVVEMPVYLRYLEARLRAGGGVVERRVLAALDEATGFPLVVNCTGLGARALLGDETMYPIRGQVVRVENPGLDRFALDIDPPEGATYVVPRSGDCILGGTAEQGSWELRPDPEVAAGIVERCLRLEPRLAGVRVLEHRVGLRPGRPAVRLEVETGSSGGRVIHNYGHGGAGVTVSWGCADEVAELAGAPR
ncbi:MAG: FAD-binding oxidoreductase [Gemmatimonadetes bacterium]|nr:FAD-binding oxidoreductase [Gemmatimonadota bacterium]